MNIIREYRERRGLTQAQLARELSQEFPGVDAPLISKMEKGLCAPTDELAGYILRGLASGPRADEAVSAVNVSTELDMAVRGSIAASVIYDRIESASRENPVSRAELVHLTQISDREVRETIARLRKAGARIASSSSTSGYWMCSGDDYAHLRAEYISRVRTIMKTVRAMDMVLPGQIKMTPDQMQEGQGATY